MSVGDTGPEREPATPGRAPDTDGTAQAGANPSSVTEQANEALRRLASDSAHAHRDIADSYAAAHRAVLGAPIVQRSAPDTA